MDGTPHTPPGHCPPGLPSRVIGNISVLSFLILVVVVLVPVRMYTRLRVAQAFWYDDGAIAISTALLLAAHGMIFKLHVDGLGNHAYCLSMPKMLAIKNLVLPVQTLSLLSLTFSRASVAILLIRLFSVAKTLKWTITAVMAIMTAFTVINIALSFEQQVGQHAELVLAYCAATVFVVSDLFLATVPIFMVRRIQMQKKQKIAVGVLLSLGYITGVCAIVRLAALSTQSSLDWTYSPLESMMAIEIEATMAIVCASIPPLRALFTRPRKTSSPAGTVGTPGSGPFVGRSEKKKSPATTAVSSKLKSAASIPRVSYRNLPSAESMPRHTPKPQHPHKQNDTIQAVDSREAAQSHWDQVNALDVTPYFPQDRILKQVDIDVA